MEIEFIFGPDLLMISSETYNKMKPLIDQGMSTLDAYIKVIKNES